MKKKRKEKLVLYLSFQCVTRPTYTSKNHWVTCIRHSVETNIMTCASFQKPAERKRQSIAALPRNRIRNKLTACTRTYRSAHCTSPRKIRSRETALFFLSQDVWMLSVPRRLLELREEYIRETRKESVECVSGRAGLYRIDTLFFFLSNLCSSRRVSVCRSSRRKVEFPVSSLRAWVNAKTHGVYALICEDNFLNAAYILHQLVCRRLRKRWDKKKYIYIRENFIHRLCLLIASQWIFPYDQ